MKPRTTLLLLVITGVLFAYLYFYDKKTPGSTEALRQAQNVVSVETDQIVGVVIQNGDQKIELKRYDKKWRLESPVRDQADSMAVENLLSDIDSWPKDATITPKEIDADKNGLNEYGLNKTKLRLKLIGTGAPPEILFGKDAALEGKMYVRFENSKETYVVSQSVRKDVEKKPDDYRDKKLTDLTMSQVSRVVVKTRAGEMEMEKKHDHWDLVRPLRARGDDQKIGDLIAQVTTAEIQQFVADDKGDLNAYGLTEPRGSIILFPESDKTAAKRPDGASGDDRGQMLQIGAASDKAKDQVYARFAPRGFVYALPSKLESILAAKPDDLRDRHLARIDRDNLDRLTIEPAGKNKIVLARKDEAWTIASSTNVAANSDEARRLIDTLAAEHVSKFVENVASNLAKYGLDKPSLQLTFSAFASENTAETKAGDHPFLTIAFGKTEDENVYARVGDEPFVLAVRRSLLDDIYTDASQWQSLVIYDFKPEQIHRLTIKTDREQSLMRGPNNTWRFADGNGQVGQTNLQSLLNAVAKLRAVRWAGANIPQPGFDKPALSVTFTTTPDDKVVQKLTVGSAAGNGLWFARVDGRDGTFVMNTPDLNALKMSLTQAPVPSPPPAGSSVPAASGGPSVAATPAVTSTP
jgi:hypothetical protein